MSNENTMEHRQEIKVRHRDRVSQIPIYLGKQLRFFINESDWKVIPMAAIIAGLVALVIRNKMFLNMEGSLIGAFALTCIGLWNGCFNSIQAVCRERGIIKREHRSGMHITSYMAAHMIYQLILCLLQTIVTVYVFIIAGVQFPAHGFMTPWMTLDIGISILLVSYASDMMSLFISSISHTTTSAMTIMPFVLIFQLIFSGGIIPLPEWTKPLSYFTISNYGIQVMASQAGYNDLPMVTTWNTIDGMRDKEIDVHITSGQILDALGTSLPEDLEDTEVIKPFTVGQLIDVFGEDNVRQLVQTTTAEAAQRPEFEQSTFNIGFNWVMLAVFAAGFAVLSTITLELIDKDKR